MNNNYTATKYKDLSIGIPMSYMVMQIPEHLLGEGFTQDQFGHPICPCGNKTEVDGGFPCEHENPLNGLI